MSEALFPQNFAYKSPDIPVQYAIPYDWGVLHVSEKAHKAYELTPFRPTQAGGLSEEEATAYDKTRSPLHISLLAPQEIGLTPKTDFRALEVHIDCGFSQREGASLNVGFGVTAAVINGSPEVHKLFVTSNMCDGYIENRGAQHIAHALVHTVCSTRQILVANHDIRDAVKVQEDQNKLKKAAFGLVVGAVALGGTEAILGADHFHINPLVLLPALVWTAGAAWRAKGNGDKYLDNKIKGRYDLRAQQDARQIESDIHETYCAAHFNKRAKESYGF